MFDSRKFGVFDPQSWISTAELSLLQLIAEIGISGKVLTALEAGTEVVLDWALPMSKASHHRRCPALKAEINSAECGRQRQSALRCPPECPHNPFAPANYEQLLEIEERLDAKTYQRFAASNPDPAVVRGDLAPVRPEDMGAMHALFVWQFFFARGAEGKTFAQRWEQEGWAGLKNDERVLWDGKAHMRMALLEVHRVFGDGRFEAVDLLEGAPGPMIFLDRSLAATAARFSTMLGWIFPLPHFWRLSGTASVIPDVAEFEAREIVREIVGYLGGPAGETHMRRWLAEHFVRFGQALAAVVEIRRRRMLAGLDAQWGKAVYELSTGFAQCRQRLDELAELAFDDLSKAERAEGFAEARQWFDGPPPIKALNAAGSRMVLGRVLLGQSHWRLEVLGGERFSRLRQQFEAQLGELVRFRGQRVDDLGARLQAQGPPLEESLAPPRLLENPDRLILSSSQMPASLAAGTQATLEAQLLRAAHRNFLDEAVPALDNRTPRQAARDPVLRRRLVQLMKQRVRSQDEQNLRSGRTEDLNWMLRELELKEIIFEPPPWRPPPPEVESAERWDGPVDEAIDPVSDRPPAPCLTEGTLDSAEALRRFALALEWFETPEEAEAELQASGATVLEDAAQLTQDILNENDFSFAIPFLLQAWFALVPKGCRAPPLDWVDLQDAFIFNLDELERCGQDPAPEALESFLRGGPQPELTLLLVGAFWETLVATPEKDQPRMVAQPAVLALLKAILDVLDDALRL